MLGRTEDVIRLAESLRAPMRAKLGAAHARTLNTEIRLSTSLCAAGRAAEAEPIARAALGAASTGDADANRHVTGRLRAVLGLVLLRLDRLPEAQLELDAGIELLRSSAGESHSSTRAATAWREELRDRQAAAERRR